jgi:cysteine desulfurase/selenocysteine lyase
MYAHEFGPFDEHLWLNCAHQGPLPRKAVEEAERAVAEKIAPHRMRDEEFAEVPARLKRALGALINARPEDIILGNSTAYGLNLLVQGLPLVRGDEILLVDGDFPSTVITWLPLRKRGINVRLFKPVQWPPTADDIEDQMSPATRVFCSSWVFSFFGHAIDLDAIGRMCRERNTLFVVNGSQAIGARAIDISAVPVDALVSCGFKWQCGPYGTGFAWMGESLLDSLTYEQAYWLAHGGGRSTTYALREDLGASRYDVFGTANFLNFITWTAAVEYLVDHSIEAVERYDNDILNRLITGLRERGYVLISPASGPSRSTLVLFTHEDRARNEMINKALEDERIHIAERNGKLRISPHLYNTSEEIDRLLEVLLRHS